MSKKLSIRSDTIVYRILFSFTKYHSLNEKKEDMRESGIEEG